MKLADEDHLKDAAFSNAFHGSSRTANAGITAMRKKDHAAHKAVVDEYFKHWDNTAARNESQDAKEARTASYATVARQYYDLVSDFYEHVLGTSFHFCRILPGVPLSMATTSHEQYLAQSLGLREGQIILDVGCGVGGPAREIARFARVNIVGLNNNDYQNQRAIRYTADERLSNQVSFVKGDFMQMRFKPESFDAAYSIEGTSYAPSLSGAYAEIFKIIQPDGTFAVYELIMTDAYNDDDLEHRAIRRGIEQGLDLTNIAKISDAIEAIQAAGFELEETEDLACRPNKIPWYYLVTGSLRHINSIWDTSRIIHMAMLRSGITYSLTGACEAVGIWPPGTQKIADNMALLADSLIIAGEKKLFTPLFFMVAKKPL